MSRPVHRPRVPVASIPLLAATGAAYLLLYVWQKQPRYFITESTVGVYKALDPGFLPHDAFVATLQGFHYQYFYVEMVAAFARLFGTTPEITLSFTALAALLMAAAATVYAIRIVLQVGTAEALLAATLLAAPLFIVGGWTLLLSFPRPWPFAQPFMIAGIGLALSGNILSAMVLIGFGSLFHPLLGGVVGAACFGASWLAGLLQRPDERSFVASVFDRQHLKAAAAFVILLLPNAVPALRRLSAFRLDDRIFVELIAFYRHPEHYIASGWPVGEFAAFGCAMIAGILMWRAAPVARIKLRFWILAALFSALLIAGYVFVEVWPTRLGGALMGFRYSIYLHLLLIFAGSRFLLDRILGGRFDQRLWGYALLFAWLAARDGFSVFAVVLAWWSFGRSPGDPGRSRVSAGAAGLAAFFALAIMPPILHGVHSAMGYAAAAVLLAAGAECAMRLRERPYHKALYAAPLVLFGLALSGAADAPRRDERTFAAEYDIARKTAELTPPDAVIVAPPGLDAVRVVGRRTLYVGFEFPFLDDQIVDWARRAQALWGNAPLNADRLRDRFNDIPDSRFRELATAGGATHVILLSGSRTRLPILYRNSQYILARIAGPER